MATRPDFCSNAGVLATSRYTALPRQLAAELYRVLPALAMSVAGVTIAITIGQALQARPSARLASRQSVAPALPSTAPSAIRTVAAQAAIEQPPLATPTAVPTAVSTDVPTAVATLEPAATAAPPTPSTAPAAPPPAEVQASWLGARRVQVEGRVLTPDAQTFYWFLISEPGRSGFFRQGPANVGPDGRFAFDLDLQPLTVGPDSVTLAGVPRDLSDTWTAEAERNGTWLPVIDVKPEGGISFLRQVGLQGSGLP